MEKQIFVFAAAALAVAPPLFAQNAADQPVSSIELPSSPFAGERSEEVLAAQVLLLRVQHSPGVIDGFPGGNTARAIRLFEQANGLQADGKVDADMMEALRQAAGDAPLMTRYTITAADIGDGFVDPASGMQEQAKTGNVGYGSAAEMLAEKFGMAQSFLEALNPGASFGEGESILVANAQPGAIAPVARIEIDGDANELRAYGEDDSLIASFPATVGSGEFPSPSGTMEVRAVAPAANYTFDPSDQEWGGDETLVIPAGPNNPVGGIWIDLTKDGYGIHGSPDPRLIGKTASHGCVRLTNWDAERLSKAVSQGTNVVFV